MGTSAIWGNLQANSLLISWHVKQGGVVISRFLSSSPGMQSLASRNGCKISYKWTLSHLNRCNSLLSPFLACCTAVYWDVLQVGWKERWPGLAPRHIRPYTYIMYIYRQGQLHLFFSSLHASSGGGEQGECDSLQTIAVFEIGEHANWPLQKNSPFWTSL